jgi:hypothetical protein
MPRCESVYFKQFQNIKHTTKTRKSEICVSLRERKVPKNSNLNLNLGLAYGSLGNCRECQHNL